LAARAVTRAGRGWEGEELACRHLEAQGFRILARNWRCRAGELDIVARDGPVTVFVEVKDRGDASHGQGFEAVTVHKRRRVVLAARLYAASQGLGEEPLRFDVVSIDRSTGSPRVRHDRDAFTTEG
jgi:putative endonuclease